MAKWSRPSQRSTSTWKPWSNKTCSIETEAHKSSEIDKHVSDSVNKLLVENQCDLTSQKDLPTDGPKELADYLNPRLFETRETCDTSEFSPFFFFFFFFSIFSRPSRRQNQKKIVAQFQV